MEVILKEDVPSLGHIGVLCKVAPGYARNYLLPKGLAVVASVNNKKQLAHQQRIMNYRRQKAEATAKTLATRLNNYQLTIARKVGDQGKLFGSVTAHDVQQALEAKGLVLERRKIQLEDPIRALGEFQIPVRLDAGVRAELKLIVVSEA